MTFLTQTPHYAPQTSTRSSRDPSFTSHSSECLSTQLLHHTSRTNVLRDARIRFFKDSRASQLEKSRTLRLQQKQECLHKKQQIHEKTSSRVNDIIEQRKQESMLRQSLNQEKQKTKLMDVLQVKQQKLEAHGVSIPHLNLSSTQVQPCLSQFQSLTPRRTPRSCGGFYMSSHD
ncbi:hypothetical protein GEMRC1_011155 [Eukaryota sp. GEM-RC1]